MLQGEHSAILSTFIKLPSVIKAIVLSIFEWPLKTGFTVNSLHLYCTLKFNPLYTGGSKMSENLDEMRHKATKNLQQKSGFKLQK